MWPLFNELNKDTSTGANQQRGALTFTDLVAKISDVSDFERNDIPLKFWLPEPAEQALDEMGKRNCLTKSEFLRQSFAIHCYGLYAFYAMKDADPSLFKERVVFYQSAFLGALPPGKKRIDTYWVPELGKNIAPIKVWLPKKLRNDLFLLAQHANLTLSNYTREIVISRLFGQGMLPTRPEMFQVSSTSLADDWIEEREVPWREVSKEECREHLVSETRPKVVDDLPPEASGHT